MKIRKTAHDYWNYSQQTQENYLNIRYQFSYLKAGYYLRQVEIIKGFVPIAFNLVIGDIALRIAYQSLKEAKII
jgi:hypothetical protein